MTMHPFIAQLDHKRIEGAIAAAESHTSGELRVVIRRDEIDDPLAAAREEFARLEMHRTREHNAVLILVAPASRKFALFGDEAIHAKCGQPFWDEVAAAMSGFFRQGKYTDGLVHGIERAGTLLAEHFPHQPDDKNELSNEVIERGPVI